MPTTRQRRCQESVILCESWLAVCPYRRVVDSPAGDTAICGLIENLAGANRCIDARVGREACAACLGHPTALPGHINPVVASLLHRALAAAPVAERQSEFSLAESRFLLEFAVQHLQVAESDGTNAADRATQTLGVARPSIANGGFVGWLHQIHVAAMRNAARMRNWPSIGLVGWNARTGLGYQNRDIAAHIPITQWLMPANPRQAPLPLPFHLRRRVWRPPETPGADALRRWPATLDRALLLATT